MMISKTKRTTWHNNHFHHNSRRDLYQLVWGRTANTYHDEAGSEEIFTPYPASVVKCFEEAIKRCPSISIHPDIMEGQPCISGTRIPVRSVLRAIEQYGAVKDVTTCYPQLTSEQVEDALYFSQVVLELPSGLDETAIAS
jgi:uncharacterized protein (DUF433 family)